MSAVQFSDVPEGPGGLPPPAPTGHLQTPSVVLAPGPRPMAMPVVTMPPHHQFYEEAPMDKVGTRSHAPEERCGQEIKRVCLSRTPDTARVLKKMLPGKSRVGRDGRNI